MGGFWRLDADAPEKSLVVWVSHVASDVLFDDGVEI
jgi:hypothetical protein